MSLENTNPKIPFIRREGRFEDYDAVKYKDTIYFANDTNQLFYNGIDYSSFIKDGSIDEDKLNEALKNKINAVDDKINEIKSEILDDVSEDFDTLKEVETWINKHDVKFNKLQNDLTALRSDWETSLENAAVGLAEKVSWSDGNHDKIALPNHGQIVGIPNPDANGAENGNASLVMLSKWNVIDLGSTKYPININGPNTEDYRPTFNDSHKLVIDTDITNLETSFDNKLKALKLDILGDDLTTTFDTLKAVDEWAKSHENDYGKLVTDIDDLKTDKVNISDFNEYKTNVTSEIEKAISDIEIKNYATNESVTSVKNELLEDIMILLARIKNIENAIMPESLEEDMSEEEEA